MERFVPLSLQKLSGDNAAKIRALRVNCLGSLYYFLKIALRRKRLTDQLHLPLCSFLERRRVKHLLEFPRDHFKSTICTEGRPMWRALPFTSSDEDEFKKLGYSDEYVRFMQEIHNPNIRQLLVSENITNAAKLGSRVRWHYESNSMYRALFPDTLPTTAETWTNFSLHVKRPVSTTGAAHGEGTFDFIGVGGALQSRHYDEINQDDLVGRKAIESLSIMEKTVEYHRLLIGAFDSDDKDHENSELVVGNRWAYHDLNSWIRENEPWFVFSSHKSLGGCCAEHPPGIPIFPQEFSYDKLQRIKKRLGNYSFSCQFENDPASPEDADFDTSWLRYYTVKVDPAGRAILQHEVVDGTVRKDLQHAHLSIAMAVDPNHSGNAAAGRCRHAIVVVGISNSGDYYLLDYWARHSSYDTFYDKIYEIAQRWKLRKVGLETIAAQKYIAHHIEHLNRVKGYPLRIVDLKGEAEAPDGTVSRKKEWRIRSVLSPIFEAGQFWIRKGPDGVVQAQDFLGEYQAFPRSQYVDILDALAYIPQMLHHSVSYETDMKWRLLNQRMARAVNQPYSTQVQ